MDEKKQENIGKTVSDIAKETAEKTAEVLETTGKKAAAAISETGRKASDVTKKTAAALEETGKKADQARKRVSSALIPEVYVQWGGSEWNCAELLERAKADYRANNKGGIHTCKLYVKPEDGTAYYVISGKEGKIAL